MVGPVGPVGPVGRLTVGAVGEEHVAWLEIPVHDATGVKSLDAAHRVAHESQGEGGWFPRGPRPEQQGGLGFLENVTHRKNTSLQGHVHEFSVRLSRERWTRHVGGGGGERRGEGERARERGKRGGGCICIYIYICNVHVASWSPICPSHLHMVISDDVGVAIGAR